MALTSSKLNIIVVLVFCVYYAHAVCTCEKTPPSGNCVCQSDNSNPARCKACICDHITSYVNGPLVCSCRPGYAVSSTDRKKCADIDECGFPTSPCQQICTNTIGNFSCSCNLGYIISSSNPNLCNDVDECNGPAGNPCQQLCTNTAGSYSCSCGAGYTVSSTNSSSCDDIDECKVLSTPPCHQICNNANGSYWCSCEFGYNFSRTDDNTCIETCKTVNSSDTRPLVNITSGLQVMCDTETDGGGWTIFQRRVSGTVHFNRNWAEYKNGFGDFSSGNFYLGNEIIYLLTSNRQTELRVDMVFSGTRYFAKYSSFNVSSETDGYRLHVGGYTGDTGDRLANHSGIMFTTFDRENDFSPNGNCAQFWKGGWWFNKCYHSYLNGVWGASDFSGINWLPKYRASFSEMKFRYV